MLDKYHHGHYRVYNLCSERGYDETNFTGGTVVTFPMDDHQVPPLPMLFEFSR
jgi:phosphatidylinositol-3,4,5-trisphosphate 3-phosphatase/dual-specificity protein phosphatase PTEN